MAYPACRYGTANRGRTLRGVLHAQGLSEEADRSVEEAVRVLGTLLQQVKTLDDRLTHAAHTTLKANYLDNDTSD